MSQPIKLNLAEPDSLAVEIILLKLPEPLKSGQQVLLQGSPNRPVTELSWLPDDSRANCPDCLVYGYKPNETTWVTLEVTDIIGCHAVDSFLLVVDPNVYAPNVFAPDKNSENDRFSLISKESLPVRRLTIFDRWGNKVFERRDFFTNDPGAGWDGTNRHKPVLPGVYVFMAEVEIAPGRIEVIKGDVTVLR
ncbi:MAG: gliding motility-associated C-terminal domain-containing protein [Alphaproteobacteria bacterium]